MRKRKRADNKQNEEDHSDSVAGALAHLARIECVSGGTANFCFSDRSRHDTCNGH